MCISRRMNTIAKKANPQYIGSRKMEFDSLDYVEEGEHEDVNFVDISKIFTTQDALFDEA